MQLSKGTKRYAGNEICKNTCGRNTFYDSSNNRRRRSSVDTRDALEVFCLYEAQGEYFVTEKCIGCKLCYSVCPQKCIDISKKPVEIDQKHCLHCGKCFEICPKRAIIKR